MRKFGIAHRFDLLRAKAAVPLLDKKRNVRMLAVFVVRTSLLAHVASPCDMMLTQGLRFLIGELFLLRERRKAFCDREGAQYQNLGVAVSCVLLDGPYLSSAPDPTPAADI